MNGVIRKLLLAADDYIGRADWKDLSLLKVCLFALGLAVGCRVGKKDRKFVFAAGLTVFALASIPLWIKFLPCLRNRFLGDRGAEEQR